MPTIEERLGVIETQIYERREAIDRRLSAIEGKLEHLTTETQKHVFKATCINGSAKIVQGASAGGGVVGAIIAIVWLLKQLGLL